MNTSRTSKQTQQPPLRFNYKTHTTPSRFSLRKDSRVKAKKENKTTLQSSQQTSHLFHLDREPLTSVRAESNVIGYDMGEFHKKESLALKKKNDHLQSKIKDQGDQLSKLKQEMQELKSSINQNVETKTKELAQVYRTSHSTQNNYKYQVDTGNHLRAPIPIPRSYPVFDLSAGIDMNQIDESSNDQHQISRRKQIMQHYEEIGQNVVKQPRNEGIQRPSAQAFMKKEHQYDEIREKYTDELRNLEQQLSKMKEKGLMAEVLEKQIENKNECIDFLRNQLEIVQTNSKQLLSVIANLEQRIDDMEGRGGYNRYQSQGKRRSRGCESFQTFSDSKY